MTLLDHMKERISRSRTMNGAVTHSGSGEAVLDLFALAGAMRYKSSSELLDLFDRAFLDNPLLTMKLLFHIRDIREGMGERESFRKMLRHAAFQWPEAVRPNIRFISEFGRFDDLFSLMGTPVEEEVIRIVKKQLKKDRIAAESRERGDRDAKISLLGKWMPSINTSSNKSRKEAKSLAKALGMSEKEYRQTLSLIRKHLHLVENRLTAGASEKIDFEAVPARAMFKYRAAFERHERDRFVAYLHEVLQGEKKIHVGTLDPHEIIRPYFKESSFVRNCRMSLTERAVIEALWRNQEGDVGQRNTLPVVDTSGSMYWHSENGPIPAQISQALGLFYAERNEGLFHNHLVTFESNPHLVELKGGSMEDRLRLLQQLPWGNSTNLMAVFELILHAAIDANASPEEMPEVLYIISDMEFDMAFRRPDNTIFEAAKADFEAAGYALPAIVFHNVNAWNVQTPVRANTRGSAMVSGTRTKAMGRKVDKNTTPMSFMLEILNSRRYSCIRV